MVLTEVFRQKEGAFVNLLNEMRRGELSPFHESLLAQLSHNAKLEAHQLAVAEHERVVAAQQLTSAAADGDGAGPSSALVQVLGLGGIRVILVWY